MWKGQQIQVPIENPEEVIGAESGGNECAKQTAKGNR